MTTDWADLDPALADLGLALDDLMHQPVTHAGVRSLTRALDRLPIRDLACRLPPPEWRNGLLLRPNRQDIRRSLEDVVDLLRDTEISDPSTHLIPMIDQACRKLLEFDHALAQPVASALDTGRC
jgi:hypothetical protein